MLPTLLAALLAVGPAASLTTPRPFRLAVAGGDTGRRAGATVYNGRAGQWAVRIPRFDAAAPIDGTLSSPVWEQAAILTGFSEYMPVDGPPAEDSTEILVWYSPTAIYFGIRAFEPHGSVHATLASRDNIGGDDHVHIIFSPFIHSRQALNFAVNPLGVQGDGTITEGATGTAGYGVNSQTGPPPTDNTPDFVWDSKGRLTSFGYEVVVRIPFRSIKLPSKDPQDWGLNVIREVKHSGHQDSWYPAKLAAATFLEQAGTLVGLRGLDRGLVLDLNPFLTEKTLGASLVSPSRGWRYQVERPQFGGNARWGITNNLLLSGTYRPDFAEVEADATQLVLDPRSAVQYPEKRPFFLDGLEQFSTPNNLIYTRQIEAPTGATKLTGKAGNISLAYLGAQDNQGSIATGGGHPLFNAVRLRQDFAQGSQVGVALTDKEDGGTFSRLAGVDARITFAKIYSISLQGAGSSSRSAGVTGAGPLWQAEFTRGGRSFIMDYIVSAIDPEFVAASGFVARSGIANGTADIRYTFYPGGFVQTFGIDVRTNETWVYRQFTAGHAPEDRRIKFTLLSTLRGGWQVLAGIYPETFGYDPALYANYYLGRIGPPCGVGCPVDTTYTRFVGTPRIGNTDFVFQLTTPNFSKFDLTLLAIGGRDENFFEWASADVSITEATLNYRPTDRLRIQLMYNAQIYWRHGDGSIVDKTLIPRLNVEYQLSRPIFFRLISQYDGTYQNNLRDDSRTNLPIFIRNPATGVFTRAAVFQSNQLQLSGLFAYQPVPGTVAFVGYGNNLVEPDGFHFNSLRRTGDGFFVKLSYLFGVH